MKPRLRALLALALSLAAGGCATPTAAPSWASDECTRWFARVDSAIDAAGVRDAQDERIARFPGLRVDRFGQAVRERLPFAQWLARAAALDRDALAAESRNLPPGAFPIDGAHDAQALRERSAACRDAWPARLAADETARRALLERATVPGRYAVALRALGLYPLLRWPFFASIQAWQDDHAAAIARWDARAPRSVRFAPADDDPWAPIIEIETDAHGTLAPFDRFGAPYWPAPDGRAPRVDGMQPVVFRRAALAPDERGRPLRQWVYTLWFDERPSTGPFDLLAGSLDGVIVRITLAADGTPLVVDTIHACGCWHQFYPRADLVARAPQEGVEWAFAPARLPALDPGQRLVVRLSSGTHQVTGLSAAPPSAAARYRLQDEDVLRSLPVVGGGRRSLYGPDGLVAGTGRAERFFFWPMGIANAGAMRQWGHHATAFVGRRHFDDPNLLSERFMLAPGAPP